MIKEITVGELIDELKDSITNYHEVKEYKKQTTYRSELDRISDQYLEPSNKSTMA